MFDSVSNFLVAFYIHVICAFNNKLTIQGKKKKKKSL